MAPMPSVLEIEAATMTAWPALQVAHDGRWIWRAARGYSKRANSIHCLDPADDQAVPLRVARLGRLYASHNLPPVFRITPLAGPGIERGLDALGWTSFDRSRVLGMAMPDALPAAPRPTVDLDPLGPQWAEAQGRMSGYDRRTLDALLAIVAAMACPSRGILALSPDGRPAAAVLTAVANGIGCFFNVVTDEAERGRGYARSAMLAALAWCGAHGAHFAALQMLAGNTAADRLYRGLGFADLYLYHYRRPL